MSLELYRQSTIGYCLIEVLQEMINEGLYTVDEAVQIRSCFDDVRLMLMNLILLHYVLFFFNR